MSEGGPEQVFLIGDIGGTNPRLAWHDGDKIISQYRYKTEDFPSLEDLVRKFMEDAQDDVGKREVAHALFAAAGPVAERCNFRFPLIPKWGEINWDTMEEHLGFPVELINDFDAQARNVCRITRDQIETLPRGALRREIENHTMDEVSAPSFSLPSDPITASSPHAPGRRLIANTPDASQRYAVIGSGTALGAATVIRNPDGSTVVLSSQLGVVPFAPKTERQSEVFNRFVADSPERKSGVGNIAGGQGLVAVYEAARQLAYERKGKKAEASGVTAEQVTKVAFGKDIVDGVDPDSAKIAVEMFTAALAQSVQTLILTNNTRGGVFLSGGVIEAIRGDLDWLAFERRLMDTGSHHHFWLKNVPVHVIKDSSDNGINGTAAYVTGLDPCVEPV